MVFFIQIYFFVQDIACRSKAPTKGNHFTLDLGSKCTTNEEITDATECGNAAASFGYTGKVHSGSWSWAPKGCFLGHPDDNYKHTFFNQEDGNDENDKYKPICRRQKDCSRDDASCQYFLCSQVLAETLCPVSCRSYLPDEYQCGLSALTTTDLLGQWEIQNPSPEHTNTEQFCTRVSNIEVSCSGVKVTINGDWVTFDNTDKGKVLKTAENGYDRIEWSRGTIGDGVVW